MAPVIRAGRFRLTSIRSLYLGVKAERHQLVAMKPWRC